MNDQAMNEALEEVVVPAELLGEEDPMLDEILSDLEQLGAVEETDEAAAATDDIVVDEELLQDLDIAVSRAENYAAQESTIVTSEKVEAPAPSSEPRKSRSTTTRVSSGTGTSRPAHDIATLPAAVFVTDAGTDLADVAACDAAKNAMIAARPAQIKIAEKFDGLWNALAAGKAASVYVMEALKAMDAKGGAPINSSDLVMHYKSIGHTDGTARSQAGQIMELFRITGIASRVGQVLTPNPNSLVAKRLREIATPTPAA